MPDQLELLQHDAPPVAPVPRRRNRDTGLSRLAWDAVRHTADNQLLDPAADPTHSHWLHKLRLGSSCRIFYGRVVDTVDYVSGYKVQPEDGMPAVVCTMGSQTSLQPFGVKEYGELEPGTGVYFLLHGTDTTGRILCVDPDFSVNSTGPQPDFISQAGRSGMAVDHAHQSPIRDENNLVADFSSGRPFDRTCGGERGWMAETGVGLHADSFMAFLRADEETGVWAFWHDQLARVAGHNLQVWSACREREDVDSYGQVDSVEGYTPYYWEGTGSWLPGGPSGPGPNTAVPARAGSAPPAGTTLPPVAQTSSAIESLSPSFQALLTESLSPPPGGTAPPPAGRYESGSYPDPDSVLDAAPSSCVSGVLRTLAPEDWQLDPALQCYSAVEPCLDDQQGFYRLRDFYGYLGQGHKRVLQLPPQPLPNAPQSYPQSLECPGVYEENLSLTGRKSIRTAHEYFVVKRLANPSPKQLRRQEDAEADTPAGYRASGALGRGPEHKVTGEVAVAGDDDPGLVRAAGFLDTQTFAFNWEGSHPFSYAKRTWLLPEEGSLAYVPSTPAPPYSELARRYLMSAPPAVPLWVDGRYGEVDYYPNVAYWGLLANGAVKLGCGWGGDVTMVDGSMWIDVPGDVNIRCARNFNVMAGQDVTVTGRNSVDVTAVDKDLRLFGQHAVYVLGGNDGCGGVLIESRATGANVDFSAPGEAATIGGVLIKVRAGLFAVCAPVQQFNVVSDPQPGDADLPTSLTFDVGTGRWRVRADYHERFVGKAALDYWPDDGVVNEYWHNTINLGAPLNVNGSLVVDGCAVIGLNVESAEGYFYSPQASTAGGLVGSLSGDNLTQARAVLAAAEARKTAAAAVGAQELTHMAASSAPVCAAGFSFRTAAQYHTEDFVMFEARWAMLNRLGSGPSAASGSWSVKPVYAPTGEATYPYPGEPWVDGQAYRTLDPALFDPRDGLAYDRDNGLYEEPEYREPARLVMNNNVPCIFTS